VAVSFIGGGTGENHRPVIVLLYLNIQHQYPKEKHFSTMYWCYLCFLSRY